LLHELGTEVRPVEGHHDTVDAWLVSDQRSTTIVLTNFALPRHPITTESVCFTLKGESVFRHASVRRIDLEHANAKRRWEQMGKPEYLSAGMVSELDEASTLQLEAQPMIYESGQYQVEVTLPPQSVAAIRFAR
jgi:xylan 1,4-beta-xylosidase